MPVSAPFQFKRGIIVPKVNKTWGAWATPRRGGALAAASLAGMRLPAFASGSPFFYNLALGRLFQAGVDEAVAEGGPMGATLAEICRRLETYGFKATLEGDGERSISGVATLEDAREGQISFLSNPKYERLLIDTQASAVVVNREAKAPPNLDLIRTDEPYAAITACIVDLHGHRKHRPAPSQPQNPFVHPSARVGEAANLFPGAYVDEDAVIGRNCVIYPGCYVGPRCRIGDDVTLFANVVVYEDCILGDRVTIHAGTVVGNDGLGYAPIGGRWVKIPQIGAVEIGADVEIGSNCSIDRATLGKTVIGRGSKLSNLIAIGHGTRIGEDCMLVAQVGLAGSVKVGDHVTLAGQVGVVGHISIGDNATIGAKAGVTNNVPAGATYLGQPAVPITEAKRRVLAVARLPKIIDSVRELEKKLRNQDAEK